MAFFIVLPHEDFLLVFWHPKNPAPRGGLKQPVRHLSPCCRSTRRSSKRHQKREFFTTFTGVPLNFCWEQFGNFLFGWGFLFLGDRPDRHVSQRPGDLDTFGIHGVGGFFSN